MRRLVEGAAVVAVAAGILHRPEVFAEHPAEEVAAAVVVAAVVVEEEAVAGEAHQPRPPPTPTAMADCRSSSPHHLPPWSRAPCPTPSRQTVSTIAPQNFQARHLQKSTRC